VSTRKYILKLLRLEGFVPDPGWPNGITIGGVNTALFVKTVRARALDVHIEPDGSGSVSHMLNGRGSTPSTEFSSTLGLLQAIRHELTRRDHPPRGKVHPDLDRHERAFGRKVRGAAAQRRVARGEP
jgi:hypothetical protein